MWPYAAAAAALLLGGLVAPPALATSDPAAPSAAVSSLPAHRLVVRVGPVATQGRRVLIRTNAASVRLVVRAPASRHRTIRKVPASGVLRLWLPGTLRWLRVLTRPDDRGRAATQMWKRPSRAGAPGSSDDTTTQPPADIPTFTGPEDTSIVLDMDKLLTLINQARWEGRQCGPYWIEKSPPLALDVELRKAAKLQTIDMVNVGFYAHTHPDHPTEGIRYWLKQTAYQGHYSNVGQNAWIAGIDSTEEEVVQVFSKSPGHCLAMMNPVKNVAGVDYHVGLHPAIHAGIGAPIVLNIGYRKDLVAN